MTTEPTYRGRVFLYPIDMTAGEWAGATAAKAADHVAKRYWRDR